jgi:hypothetical protein
LVIIVSRGDLSIWFALFKVKMVLMICCRSSSSG